jgi:hypothetical protein
MSKPVSHAQIAPEGPSRKPYKRTLLFSLTTYSKILFNLKFQSFQILIHFEAKPFSVVAYNGSTFLRNVPKY